MRHSHPSCRSPGTEFLDAETRRQKWSFKRANARRDQNPRIEWPEIPAETPYLASSQKRSVCKGWVVVCAVGYEPVSTWNSLLSTVLQGNSRKMTGFAEFWSSIVLQFQSVNSENSLSMGAGNFLELAGKLQGNLIEEQGISESARR
jgi:hypothetical protein